MSDEKVLERALLLIQTLHKRTREGKVNWEPIGNRVGAFQADFGEVEVMFREEPDSEYPNDPDYFLSIIKKDTGTEVETISNMSLRAVSDRKTPEGLRPYNILQETFQMAKRQALKVDDTLDYLLKELEGPGE